MVAIPFCQAEHITAERRTTGTGEAVTVRYEGFAGTDYAFETHVWIESTTGDVIAEWVPLNDAALDVTRVTRPRRSHSTSRTATGSRSSPTAKAP